MDTLIHKMIINLQKINRLINEVKEETEEKLRDEDDPGTLEEYIKYLDGLANSIEMKIKEMSKSV